MVHDYWIYAQVVDYQRRCVVLHAFDPHVEPHRYVDVIFEGVVAHHFQMEMFGGFPEPVNVVFYVEEADPAVILGQYEGLLAETKNYGPWPVKEYEGLEDLVS